jgi:Domain of Unknown Function (DUF1080)
MKKLSILLLLTISLSNTFAQNTLSKAEKNQGWKLLFDGKTTKGWHTFNKTTIGSAWKVKDGTLMLDTTAKADWQVKDGGDIVTDESYENYDFKVDWKISKNGNSGIIFNVKEDPSLAYVWHSGPEFQVADKGHPDAKIFKHAAGDLYDLIPSIKPVAKFDAWNTARIVNNKGLLKLYLNGTKVVETRIDGQSWKDLIAGSKFKSMPEFGKYLGGHLSLQDHGNAVWFRNIKIRKL